MTSIFVSHVEEDADVALEIALGLEKEGYSTWSYEINSIPGPSYLTQTGQAVEESGAIVVVISPNSLGSRQVTNEVIRAHESNTEFIPILRGITHAEFQTRQPEWREAIGAASSTSIPPEGVAPILPRIITGLRTLGITPETTPDTRKINQLEEVLDNIRKHGTPVSPITTGPETAIPDVLYRNNGQKLRGRKRWLKPVLITVAIVTVVAIGSIAFRELFIPDTPPVSPPVPEVETPQPTTGLIDDFKENKKEPPPLSPILPDSDVVEEKPSPEPAIIVNIPDKNLRAAINGVLGKSSAEEVTDAELARITFFNGEQRGITDLTGIEYLVNLTSISLGENQISDISPLSSLTKLNQIYLWHNQISDISPLSSLTGLNRLILGDNQISDISALSSLTRLAVLEMSMNQVSDLLPLSSCTNLVELEMEGNLISDISVLSSLTNLSLLDLRENQISNISTLSSLTKLAVLELQRNQISDISALSPLENLTILDLNDNLIRNVSPLISLTKLTTLSLDSNNVKNIKPISSLINLNELSLRWNQISDIQPLVDNSGLSDWDVIYLVNNPLSDISLNTYIPQLEERGVEVSFDEGHW